MDFIKKHKITEELLNSFNSKITFKLNKRLDDNNNIQEIDELRDWNFLRAFFNKKAINNYLFYSSFLQ